jgi:hypothetical protein
MRIPFLHAQAVIDAKNKKMKHLEITLCLLSVLMLDTCMLQAQGLIPVSEAEYAEIPEWGANELLNQDVWYGFAANSARRDSILKGALPEVYSLRSYCPLPVMQGDAYVSVGWATSYFQLSTQVNALQGRTDELEKQLTAFDPLYLQATKKTDANWCEQGLTITDAYRLMKRNGNKPLMIGPWYHCGEERNPVQEETEYFRSFAIADWRKVDFIGKGVNALKQALVAGNPLTCGIPLNPSIIDGSALKNGVFQFSSSDLALGHHAICIIGYDDTLDGGSFEVAMNYGLHYGDKGFGYIRYSDFSRFVKEAYVIELNQQDWPKPENEQTILKAPASSGPSRIFAGWSVTLADKGGYTLANREIELAVISGDEVLLTNKYPDQDFLQNIVFVFQQYSFVK